MCHSENLARSQGLLAVRLKPWLEPNSHNGSGAFPIDAVALALGRSRHTVTEVLAWAWTHDGQLRDFTVSVESEARKRASAASGEVRSTIVNRTQVYGGSP